MNSSTYAPLAIIAFAVAIAHKAIKTQRPPPPPGPKPLPLIGNLLDFPKERVWVTYTEWKEKYGDLVYINVLGQPILVLGSHEACTELLDKRSAIFSDRPRLPMIGELLGLRDWSLVAMRYSPYWRRQRRLFHQSFSENASKEYQAIQEQSTHNLLRRLARDPENFLEHTRLSFAEPFLRAVYGINAQSYNDKYVQLLEKAMDLIMEAGFPGRFLVDFFPILEYVPSWLPGAGFKRWAAVAKQTIDASVDLPAEFALDRTTQSDSSPTVFSQLLSRCEQESTEQGPESPISSTTNSAVYMARRVAADAFMTGSDTTLATTQSFILVLANHPEVQRAAQAELDAVVGSNRLPTFNDMKDLPYISAIIKELLRWHPVAPLAIPHRLIQDDIYNGYLIPKGTLVFSNLQAILHNPDVYPNPHEFDPSRWLTHTPDGMKINDSIPEPNQAFGYGRRVCPGRHFAANSLFITVSSILACFNIAPLDNSGKPAEKVPERFTDGVISYPEPYRVSFVPRSDKVLELLKELDA